MRNEEPPSCFPVFPHEKKESSSLWACVFFLVCKMGIAIDHKMGIAIDPKMGIATSKFSHWRAWPFNVILHLCILPKRETRNVADVAPSPVDNMRNNSHIKTHNQVRKATSSSSKEFRYRVCLSDLSLHRLHALLLLHGQVLGMGSFATRIWHWFGLLEKVWLANWVQVWRGSTLNGLVVPLGQNKQEELVPVCRHFIHKWWLFLAGFEAACLGKLYKKVAVQMGQKLPKKKLGQTNLP